MHAFRKVFDKAVEFIESGHCKVLTQKKAPILPDGAWFN
jgi:hypothetical protein